MEFRQLRYFLEIVKCGGFTKASEALGIAQSALSITVRKLEDDIGIILIDRNVRKLTLTAEGEVFMDRAEQIIGRVNALYHEMEEFKGLVRGALQIGIPGMLATHYFPEKITEFRERYPNLQISIYSDGAKKLEAMLCAGRLDVAILGEECLSPELTWKQLLNDEMVACVGRSHRLAKTASLTIRELAQETLFLFQEGNYQRAMIDEAFGNMGKQPDIAFETNLTSLLKAMTAKGGGVCTLLKMAAEDSADLVPIPLKPTLEITAGIAWRTNAYLSLAAKAFIDFLIEKSPKPQ